MSRHSRALGAPWAENGSRFTSEVSKPVGFRSLTRARIGVLAALFLAPLLLTNGGKPSPAWAISTRRGGLVGAVAMAPDGRRIATAGCDGGLILWEAGRGVEAELIESPSRVVASLGFSPDGAILAAGFLDGMVELWSVATRSKRATLIGHAKGILCLAFSADGTRLATGSGDESVRLWDVASKRATSVLTGHGRAVCGVRFSPDGRTLATASAQGLVKLWAVDGGEARERGSHRAHRLPVRALAFSPDGSTLASGSDGDGLELRDVAIGRDRSVVGSGGHSIRAIEFSADGRTLFEVTVSGIVQRWDVASGRAHVILRDPPGFCHASFSPDARLLITTTDAITEIWDLSP